MSVAWIGDRSSPFEEAARKAAILLDSSRCPVITIDADIDGTRAAVGLAKRVGAVYDTLNGASLARETALFADRGAMLISAGEARRRADAVVVVGALPEIHEALLADFASTAPDLPVAANRQFFVIGQSPPATLRTVAPILLSCGSEAATLAALRAGCAGRQVTAQAADFPRFAEALSGARFVVFLFSGSVSDGPTLEMLLGLVSDLNRKRRAAALFLPASDAAWGATLASTWLTGFPMRTGFARGYPEHDPWRFDSARMLADGESDLHLRVRAWRQTSGPQNACPALIAVEPVGGPVGGAAITFAIGEPGVDHDAVLHSTRAGTLAYTPAKAPATSSSAASVLRAISELVPGGAAVPC